jgi:serine/threonine protein kinase
MSLNHARITDLYHRALERAPQDRLAFLEQACGADDALRAEVESLLGYDASSFLEEPAAATTAGTLVAGRRIGPYTIVAQLGVGGMGEVYRARDSKLGRDVAIKILPSHFTSDPERRARFAHEARVLATLNHPNIGAIHGLEQSDGMTALVLELIEGPTLADRLERGALPVADALSIAHQIAEAVDAAHERGIVHRDLKPANIVLQSAAGPLSHDVRVKVLDFGLAKSTDSHHSPTISAGSTAEGRTIGTPAYMSPEQARGLPVDHRTDVWAFGCVVFEMLTGKRAFEGATVTDTLARVLDREPDWTQLPAGTPSSVRTLLQRCLRKDPHKRLHDIADALIELDELGTGAESGNASRRSDRTRRLLALAAVLALVLLGAVTAALLWNQAAVPGEPIELSVNPPKDWLLVNYTSFAVSPNGRSLAVIAESKGARALWRRSVTKPEWQVIPETESAFNPFWSPDSESLGFFADGRLKTVNINTHAIATVCETPNIDMASGTWSQNGTILFASIGGLMKVSGAGGTPMAATMLGEGDTIHLSPSFLPDGNHFLYFVQGRNGTEVRVGSLTSTKSTSLGPFESNAIFARDHLLFVRGTSLMARPFDTATLQLTGTAATITNQAAIIRPYQRGVFSVSSAGVLAYRPTGWTPTRLTWIDREGKPLQTLSEPRIFVNIDLRRDDQSVAVSEMKDPTGAAANVDIRLIDLTRAGVERRLTLDPAREFDPAWSSNGDRVAFNSSRTNGFYSLFMRASDGSGQDELLVDSSRNIVGPSWSPDDKILMYAESNPPNDFNLRTFSLVDRTSSDFLKTQYSETRAMFSPDGHWVAYQSDESGRMEIYVRPFPQRDPPYQVSRDGGTFPKWRRDGTELFFLTSDFTLMSAAVNTKSGQHQERIHVVSVAKAVSHRIIDICRGKRRQALPFCGSGRL